MRTVVTYILSMVLAGLFLVSFTGLRLLIHQCMACESTDYYLFAKVEDCCETHHDNHSQTCSLPVEASNSCCAETPDNENKCQDCCQDEVIYLKKDYEVSNDRQYMRIEPFVAETLIWLMTDDRRIPEEPAYTNTPNYPPPLLVGKNFILYTHQLKTEPVPFQA